MKAYSSVDILGKESNLAKIQNPIVYLIETWIDRKTLKAPLKIQIPHDIYMRTKSICDWIQDYYRYDISIEIFLEYLFKDFFKRVMKKHIPIKIYEELTQYESLLDTIEINDPMNNKVYKIKRNNSENAVFTFFLSKKEIKRGEIILSGMDSAIGKHFTVEGAISRLWINFIQAYSDGNNEKAVDKIIKMLAKNS